MRISIGIVIISRTTNKILLVERNDYNKYWSMITGGFEKNDLTHLNTIKREMYEELELDYNLVNIKRGSIEFLKDKNMIFKWYIGLVDYEFDPILCNENLSYGWFDINEVPNNLYPNLMDKLQQSFKKIYK